MIDSFLRNGRALQSCGRCLRMLEESRQREPPYVGLLLLGISVRVEELRGHRFSWSGQYIVGGMENEVQVGRGDSAMSEQEATVKGDSLPRKKPVKYIYIPTRWKKVR